MNHSNHLFRTTAIVLLSLLILFIVIQFAPSVQAPADELRGLTTRVAAVTVVPRATETALAVPAPAQTIIDTGTFIFAAERAGYTELYAAPRDALPDTTQWKQLTRGYDPVRAPALSRDAARLAFQSRRDGNWEIYILGLQSGAVSRVTNAPAYDGAPAWSHDGTQLAFESYRAGEMDIWRASVDGTNPVNLTADDDAYNFAPAWSPDGKTLVFTGWATGSKQLYAMSPDGKQRANLSGNRFHDEQAAWSPDGKQIAFVSNREACAETVDAQLDQPPLLGSVDGGNCQRRTIFVAPFDGTKLGKAQQVTFFGHDMHPLWSPDGKQIAFLAAQAAQQPLYLVPLRNPVAHAQSDNAAWIDSAVWSPNAVRIGTAPVNEKPLYTDKPIDATDGSQYDFTNMKEVFLAPSWGILSTTVSESYRALRKRVVEDSGVDFLATLSDMTRLIGSRCDNTCDDLSWHKSGRAVDTLLSMPVNGKEAILLVRQDIDSEVYWRVYLRATKQDGSMGEPLTEAPWDLSYNARANLAPGLGGVEAPVANGYYVDFTRLAHLYGWARISSHDDVDFDWRNNREAIEFWHFQKEDGLTWWQAMQQVYTPQLLTKTFDWNTIINAWEKEPSRVYLKDVPPAPNAWKWFALIPARQLPP